jgi:hypothetical protein
MKQHSEFIGDLHEKDGQSDECLEQWSTGLGFDGPTKKACLVVGLSRLMDKPVAKCGSCERELRESNISRLYVE